MSSAAAKIIRPAARSDFPSDEFFDVASAAAFLRKSQKSVRARIARRSIPFRRWGRRIVFSRSELCEFLRELEGCEISEALTNARHDAGASALEGEVGRRRY